VIKQFLPLLALLVLALPLWGAGLPTYYISTTSQEVQLISSQEGKLLVVSTTETGQQTLSGFQLSVNEAGQGQVLYLAKDKKILLEKLIISPLPTFEPVTLYSGFEPITNQLLVTTEGAVYFQAGAFNYLMVKPTWSQGYSQPRMLSGNLKPQKIYRQDNLWFYVPIEATNESRAIFFPNPPPPIISSLKQSGFSLEASIILPYRADQRVTLQSDSLSTAEAVVTSLSQEAIIILTLPTKEGEYFFQARTDDGFTQSPLSAIKTWAVDKTPPKIILASTSREVSSLESFSLEVAVNEPGTLTVNGTTKEVVDKQAWLIKLRAGINLITIEAKDYSKNSAQISKEVIYSPLANNFVFQKPAKNYWVKPGATLLVQAKLLTPPLWLTDESEGSIYCNQQLLAEPAIFDLSTNEASALIKLPDNLPEGENTIRLLFHSQSGSLEGTTSFFIDKSSPKLASQTVFTNQTKSLSLNLTDAGSGVDPTALLFTLKGTTLESITTTETGTLTLNLKYPLSAGSYEANLVARDKSGNIGPATKLVVVVDQLPPKITLATYESEVYTDKLTLQGTLEELSLAALKVTVNNRFLTQSKPGQSFQQTIQLDPGKNLVSILATDQAGNTTEIKFSVTANFSAAGVLVNDCSNGPNPFSPANGETTYITYNLAATPVTIRAMIFDLNGVMVWQKQLAASSSGALSWNGFDHFGQLVDRGVYPYLMEFTSGSAREIKRGKIAVN